MKDLNDRFETWYRLTHWMSPPLDRRAGNGEYEDAVVHCMYLAYRAGFNRARKESKAELRRLHEANEAFGKRQEWWNERMFELEQQRDELRGALRNVYEIWAGSEAFEPVTAAEGYLLQLVKQMRDAAMEGLK